MDALRRIRRLAGRGRPIERRPRRKSRPVVYGSCSHGLSPIGYVLPLDTPLVVFRWLAEEAFARLRLERPTWAFPPREDTLRTRVRVSDRLRGS